MKFKEHVQTFESFRESLNAPALNEAEEKLNEKDEKKLTDEQLISDYGTAYFYMNILSNASNFAKFIQNSKTIKSFVDNIEDMQTEDQHNINKIAEHAILALIKCLDPEAKVERTKTDEYDLIKVGYNPRALRTKLRHYKEIGFKVETKDGKTSKINVWDTVDEYSDVPFPTGLPFFKELFGELDSSEIVKRIKDNWSKVVSSSDFKPILKSIKIAQDGVKKGEDKLVQKAKRTAQNWLNAIGL